jgi:hypothetical protein
MCITHNNIFQKLRHLNVTEEVYLYIMFTRNVKMSLKLSYA